MDEGKSCSWMRRADKGGGEVRGSRAPPSPPRLVCRTPPPWSPLSRERLRYPQAIALVLHFCQRPEDLTVDR